MKQSTNSCNQVRTIKQAADYLRLCDPDTPITEYTIRHWILSGDLPTVRAGNKYLINLETLTNFLKGTMPKCEN